MDITEICADLRNYFIPASKRDDLSFIHAGKFEISGNTIAPLDFIAEGQYFRIVGSAINDGVYCNTADGLKDLQNEVFDGAIWEMSVPRSFVALCKDISNWRKVHEAADSANMSPFSSESFAGYSYNKSGSNSVSGGSAATWQNQFAKRLNAWRRLSVL